MKPSEYLPSETLARIHADLAAAEEETKKLEAGIADMRAVGIDVMAREESLREAKEWQRKWRAVYGYPETAGG